MTIFHLSRNYCPGLIRGGILPGFPGNAHLRPLPETGRASLTEPVCQAGSLARRTDALPGTELPRPTFRRGV